MRKIIILPEFSSSHLIKCSIPNWIDVLEPDIIIINSGLFPNGPENKGHIDDEFRQKWCYQDTNAGFDFDETKKLVDEFNKNQWMVTKEPRIILNEILYNSNDVNECFLQAITTPNIFDVGDIILPLEPDVLFHENDKEKIQDHLKRLTPGDGISCKWIDFLETQLYTESINVQFPKFRRFAYCFDTMENYKKAMNAFMTQDYKSLRKVHDFIGFHYPWFCPTPWKQLRFELIYRKDPQYWQAFESGLQQIRKVSEEKVRIESKFKEIGLSAFGFLENTGRNKVLIRPSRQYEARWAKFIDIQHPKHIQNHPNFVK